jgi:asparagine synthase (glutamine-hydrolysing)
MCGLAGRFHPATLPLDKAWHARAGRLLEHRGPDGSGHYADDRCELVHRRLALIDLSPTGHQPMTNRDQAVWVVYNGEIYNHRELRVDLARRGYTFRGTSDTEVLVHLYEEFGAGMVEWLRGMFAFAVYDRPRRRLLLARDRYGIKPLYYAETPAQFLFASEMKAILAVDGFTPAFDRQACYDYLGIGYIPDPLTGFKEIRALPKGCTLEIDASGSRIREYYRPTPEPEPELQLADAANAASDAMLEAVRDQSVADVPVAALLSGGIDSSLAVAAYSRATGTRPSTFTVSFPDPAYDESAAAETVARHYSTAHTTLPANDWRMQPDAICDLLAHFDQPFADTSLIPMYRVAKAIRDRGIICALSGDGGDEAFGGYARFPRANKLMRLMSLPQSVLGTSALSGSLLARCTKDRGRQIAKAMRLAMAGRSDTSVLVAGLSSYLSETEKEDLIAPDLRAELETSYRHFNGFPKTVRTLDELSRHLTGNLFEVSLPGDMLRKVDMMSMRASVEIRVPMLDERMVELGLRLPHRLKTDGRRGKLVLRALAAQWLPPRVAALPKHGFTVPLDVILTRDFHVMLHDLLLAPTARIRGIFRNDRIAYWLRLFQQSQAGRRDGSISREGIYQRVFIALGLELWMRKYRLAW